MLALLDLQRALRAALVAGDGAAASFVAEDGITVADRLDVYRNNIVASLTAALEETFPVVRRLVDERFFAFAAHEFIRDHLPESPCLSEYGARFPVFLAEFPPCRDLVYLADVARLEWLLHWAAGAAGLAPLSPSALHAIAAEDAARLAFAFQPHIGYVRSPWPVAQIWRANRTGVETEETIDLGTGGMALEIRRVAGAVEFRELTEPVFAFRAGLREWRPLGAAADAALALHDDFDAAAALGALFAEGAVAAYTLMELEEPR